MDKISQLMDGELGEQASRLEIRRLEQDETLIQAWATYHLIRDVLRDEAGAGAGLAARVCERLQHEPVVFAPRARLTARAVRYSLPMAATVAGVAVVAWLAFFSQPQQDSRKIAENVAHPTSSESVAAVPATVRAPVKGEMNRYLLAHQEFSPTTAMQGVGSYVRTVWNEDSDLAR
jgi:sigma-E factor negative regulatory protein RseA